MKVAIYARESSADLTKAPPIEEQIKRAKEWIEENGHELVQVYQDNGYSGGDWRRPEWHQAIKDAKRHHYQMLVTWNQDRLARDTEQFLYFYRNLKEAGVKVFSLIEGDINLETVGGIAKHTTIALAAQLFKKVTSEKVQRAYISKKKEAEKKGISHFWGRKPINLDMVLLQKLKQEGFGYRKIARKYAEKTGRKISYTTVYRALQNPHKK